ncbi:hypothetical protein [Sediminibacterium sp.]|uniref:hypothetical protein n=1 Tax=Sediminibacterium sp. TaxID=1917865 RepID=UPI00272FCF01|nr:hypothetical protein [Sediminibacterium sp.]MDP2419665.1 hypothetical protein [Sediminibacterium sp.]
MQHTVLQTIVKTRQKLENVRYAAGEITGKLEITAETHNWLKELVIANIVDSQLIIKGKSYTIDKLQVTDALIAEVTLYISQLSGAHYFESINELIDLDCTQLPIYYFYIHRDNYFSDDPEEPQTIIHFRRVTELVILLKDLCDYKEDVNGQHWKLTFFAKKKISFETKYNSNQLSELDGIEKLKDHFLNAHDKDQRKEIFKTELVNFLFGQPDNLMFGTLVYEFKELIKNYEISHAIYIEQFSYIDIKNQVDKDKLDYVKKIAAIVNDIQSKIIAVPAAYLLILTMVDFKKGFTFKNNLSILAGMMFAVLLELLLSSQFAVLKYTSKEIDSTTKALKEKANAAILDEFTWSLDKLNISIVRQSIYLWIFRAIVWSVPLFLLICTWTKAG